jgi:hypothetical protein
LEKNLAFSTQRTATFVFTAEKGPQHWSSRKTPIFSPKIGEKSDHYIDTPHPPSASGGVIETVGYQEDSRVVVDGVAGLARLLPEVDLMNPFPPEFTDNTQKAQMKIYK